MTPYSPLNGSFNCRHHRSCAVDMRADLDPATDWTASPTLVASDTQIPMVPLAAFEDIVAAAIEAVAMQFYHGELRYDPPPQSYTRGHQVRLAKDIHGWRRQRRVIRDIEDHDKKVAQQRARIEALEAEVKQLKQDQVDMESFYEEQDVAVRQDLDDIYQLILDMEHDVKAAESTRVELKVKHDEEREKYLALEAALEAERWAIWKRPDDLLQDGVGESQTEERLWSEVRVIRDDIDALRVEVDAIKADADVHALADEMDALQAHVQRLEKQLRRRQLLAAEERKIAVAEITCLAAERDKARKIADQYVRRLQSLKNDLRSRSHLTPEVERHMTRSGKGTRVPTAESSSLQDAVAASHWLSMALVHSLILERDVLREQKAKVENENERTAVGMNKLRGVDCCRRDEHEQYCRRLAAMKSTIAKLTRERDAAIDARQHSDSTLVDVPSQVILSAASSGTARELGRMHGGTIKAGVAEWLDGSCQGRPMVDVDLDVPAVDSSEDGWISSAERSFRSDDFGGTSTPPLMPVSGESGDDGNTSLESACSASMVTPSHDAEPEPNEFPGDVSLSSSPRSDSMHLDLDPLEPWQCRAPLMVGDVVALDYLGRDDGPLSISNLLHFSSRSPTAEVGFPRLSRLVGEVGSKYTGKCGRISDPSVHRIRNEPVTRTANIVRNSSNYGLLPPSWSERRVFEPP